MVDQPEDAMCEGEEVNLLRFNESFYMSSPADYLTTRLHLLLLAAGKTEELRQLLEAGVEYAGVSLVSSATAAADDDADDSERSIQRFVAVESQQLLHHACETALRMFLVHSASPTVPWVELAAERNFKTFKERVRSTLIDSTPEPELIAWVCLGATEPHDGMPGDDWTSSIEGLGAFLRAFAECVLDEASLYNGIKHGLGVSPGDAVLVVDNNQLGFGPSIEYPESGAWDDGRREWSLTTRWLDLSYSMGMTYVASEIIDSIWRIGRLRCIGGDASGHLFFPKTLRPEDLRGSKQAPVQRMSWRLIVEERLSDQ